ncbi:hypothetical protein HanXRQr2_Chr12g0540351 [Helianthus annuus]|uniref:Uncharacterized protein n=1 Tax=Helianthus annuus TaxID=4232 RepID=A0A9K3HGB9_HELAN|nr:hypothetical protein HanXRQr2_Chr12g0540351 [Helianthus annuus]
MNLVGKQSMMPLKASTTTANSQARVVRSKAQRDKESTVLAQVNNTSPIYDCCMSSESMNVPRWRERSIGAGCETTRISMLKKKTHNSVGITHAE